MERQPWNLVFLLLGILRVLGAFPYRWRHLPGNRLRLERSVVAIIWSWLVAGFLVSLSVSCLVNKPTKNHGITWTISTYILNYVTYIISAILSPYMVIRSAKLAHILRRLDQNCVPVRRRVLGLDDGVQVMCVLGILGSLGYVTYDSLVSQVFTIPVTTKTMMYRLSSAANDFLVELTAVTMALLLYFLLKILGHESEINVMLLRSSPPAAFQHTTEDSCKCSTTLPQHCHHQPQTTTEVSLWYQRSYCNKMVNSGYTLNKSCIPCVPLVVDEQNDPSFARHHQSS